MTDKNLTELVCVLDRSGSMHSIIGDAIGGINGFIDEQQKVEGEARLTTVLFDNEILTVHESVPIQEVEPFNSATYRPRGSTALFDAVGSTIDALGDRLSRLPEEKRPGKVLFVILTDGHENASRRYSTNQVKEMIKRQQDEWKWEFIYLSADVNAFDHGRALGISTQVQYSANAASLGSTFSVASTAARQYRHGGAQGMSIHDSCVDVSETGNVTIGASDNEKQNP